MTHLFDQEQMGHHKLKELLMSGDDFQALVDRVPHMKIFSDTDVIEIVNANGRIRHIEKKYPKYLDEIIRTETIEEIGNFLVEYFVNQSDQQTVAFVKYVQLEAKAEVVPLLFFVTSLGDPAKFVLRLPILGDKWGQWSPKMEQIVRMYQFKLKHFKRFKTLTDREVQVLTLLANGSNNPQIADELYLSRQTIETHRKNLKRKLDLSSHLDLMRYAFAFDLIEC